MQISRSRSIYLALATLAITFSVGLLILSTRPSTNKVAVLLKEDQKIVDQAKSNLTLRDFHRSESRDGILLWEITASQGDFYTELNTADLQNPSISMFSKDRGNVNLTAPKGSIKFQGQSLERAQMSGGALLKDPRLQLSSPDLLFEGPMDSGMISSDSGVVITGDGVRITGKTLRFSLKKELAVVSGDVISNFSAGKSQNK